MKIKKSFQFLILPLVILLGGCCSVVHWPWCPPDQPTLSNWFDVERDIAATLNKNNGSTNWQIAAITGAIYPPGTVIYNGQPYKSCQFPNNVITNVPFAALPVITNSGDANFAVNLPASLAAKLGLTVNINISSTNVFYMRFSNLNQVFIYTEDFKNELTNSECQNMIDADDQIKSILRGEITGTFEVSSSSTFGIGGSVTLTNVIGISAQYNSSGAYDIQQTNPVPIFAIYSDIIPTNKVSNLTINSAIGLKAPEYIIVAEDDKSKYTAYQIEAPSPEEAAVFGGMTNALLDFNK